jgi:hypothetical protein
MSCISSTCSSGSTCTGQNTDGLVSIVQWSRLVLLRCLIPHMPHVGSYMGSILPHANLD